MTGVLFTVYGAQVYLYGYSEKLPHLVTFYDTLGIQRTHSRLKPPGPHTGGGGLL